MEFATFYFRVFQTANFLAACLLIFEVLSVSRFRWRSEDWSGPIVTFPMFLIGAFAAGLVPMATFVPRVFDNGVFWLGLSTAPLFANLAITLMFMLVFWFVHYTRKEDHRNSMMVRWRTEHLSTAIIMAIIMAVSISANLAERVGG